MRATLANLLSVVFGCLMVVVNQEPQVIFGFVLIVLMTITAFLIGGAQGKTAS